MGRRFSGRCLLSLHSNLAGFAGAGLLIYLACLCGEWLSHREGASEEKDGVGDLQEWGGTVLAGGWAKPPLTHQPLKGRESGG